MSLSYTISPVPTRRDASQNCLDRHVHAGNGEKVADHSIGEDDAGGRS
jgi:hypothetical protein